MQDEQLRLTMVAAAAAVADGRGADRIVEALSGQGQSVERSPILRPARPEDSRLVWLWRNDFVTRQCSQETAPISWPDHKAWWDRTSESANRKLVIAEIAGEMQYQIVLPKSQVVVVANSLDITSEVMKRLNRKLPQVTVSLPQQR